MLTHYIVTVDDRVCSLIGERVIHRDGVLVPKYDDETPFYVTIDRAVKRSNQAARAICEKAIRRTHCARRWRWDAILRAQALSKAIDVSDTVKRFDAGFAGLKVPRYRIVGMKHLPV